jgi:hypothetical protein
MLTDSLVGRLIEVYRKLAIGRVHLELSPGSTCFRLFPGNLIRSLRDDMRRANPAVRGCPQSKENCRDEF